jgi:hypothetical protein
MSVSLHLPACLVSCSGCTDMTRPYLLDAGAVARLGKRLGLVDGGGVTRMAKRVFAVDPGGTTRLVYNFLSVFSQNATVHATDPSSPYNAGARFQILANGTAVAAINSGGGFGGNFQLFAGNPNWLLSGINSAVQVMFTLNSGVAPTTGTLNTWLGCQFDHTVQLVRTSFGLSTSVIQVQFRDAVSLSILSTCLITLQAEGDI